MCLFLTYIYIISKIFKKINLQLLSAASGKSRIRPSILAWQASEKQQPCDCFSSPTVRLSLTISCFQWHPKEGLNLQSIDQKSIALSIMLLGAQQPRLDSDQRIQQSKCCALPLGDWAINQDAAFSIDLPTDLSFQLERVRIELTTHSLTMNLLQASFFILHIYYIKIFNIFQKRELGANHPLHHPTKSYSVNT